MDYINILVMIPYITFAKVIIEGNWVVSWVFFVLHLKSASEVHKYVNKKFN